MSTTSGTKLTPGASAVSSTTPIASVGIVRTMSEDQVLSIILGAFQSSLKSTLMTYNRKKKSKVGEISMYATTVAVLNADGSIKGHKASLVVSHDITNWLEKDYPKNTYVLFSVSCNPAPQKEEALLAVIGLFWKQVATIGLRDMIRLSKKQEVI